MLEHTRLLGRIVMHLSINADQSVLMFNTDKEDIFWHTRGDCCSESWFADVIGVSHLLNKTITKLEVRELDDPKDGRSRQYSDEVYGISIFTTEGICDIAFRNSSNGYYTGRVYEENTPPNGVLFRGHVPLSSEEEEGQLCDVAVWHELTSDYSA